MPTTFVTAAQDEMQVTSHQARLSHANTFGAGRYLLDGFRLAMETPNSMKAGPGVLLVDGSYITVDESGEKWPVENGSQGMKRVDIAGYQYSVDEFGVERIAPKVLKGTPHQSAPADPEWAKGSLLERPAELFVPVARVRLDGITVLGPESMLDQLPTLSDVAKTASAKTDGKVLWSGAWWGTGDAVLSERVSAQKNGIVLVWSAYENGAKEWSWIYQFVPRWHAVWETGTRGVVCSSIEGEAVMAKYLYVHDGKIVGHPKNEQVVSVGGITADNRKWALRYVLGV